MELALNNLVIKVDFESRDIGEPVLAGEYLAATRDKYKTVPRAANLMALT